MNHPTTPLTSRRLFLALTAATGAGLLASCAATPGSATASGTPIEGGTLTVALPSIPDILDASITPAWNYPGRAVVDNLVDLDADGQIVPYLATSWEVNDDNTQFTFHLRDDVTFSNGEPLTANDVKATFDGAISFRQREGQGVAAGYLTGYESTTVVDDRTAVVTFTTPRAGFLEAASEKALGIIWSGSQADSLADRSTKGIIGSGPFTITDYTANQSVTITRREDYNWSSSVTGHTGPAHLESVTFVEVPETGVIIDELIAEEVDAVIEPDRDQRDRVTAAGLAIDDAIVAGIPYSLIPNVRKTALGDVKVRRALQKALKRQEIHDTVYGDGAAIASAPISSTTPYYEDLSSSLGYDLDGATALLEESGWTVGGDGIRVNAAGDRLTLTYPFTSETDKTLLQLLQSQLAEAGIELSTPQLSDAQYTAAFADDEWDLTRIDFSRADPDALLSGFHPDYLYMNWFDHDHVAELVSLLDAETGVANDTERATAVHELLTYMINEAYTFPLNERSHSVAHLTTVTVAHEPNGWPQFYDAARTA